MTDRLPLLYGCTPPWDQPATDVSTALARDLGEDPDDITRLCWEINAPASLQCLDYALRSLRQWLPDVAAAGGLTSDGLASWQGVLSRVVAALGSSANDPAWRARHELLYRETIRNLCEPHPYYAALISLYRIGPDGALLSRIMARVWPRLILAHHRLSDHQRIAVGRALRSLYDDHGPRPRLDSGATDTDSALVQALEDAAIGADSLARGQLQLLQRLLTGALAESEGHGGGGGGHGGGTLRGRRRLQDRIVVDEIGIDVERPAGEIAPRLDFRAESRTRRPDGREHETEPFGLAPGDLGESAVYASAPPVPGQTMAQRIDRLAKRVDAHAISADIAMRSQPLPHRWELLTSAELAIFFEEVEQLLVAASRCADAATRAPEPVRPVECSLAILLMTMLIRGMDADTAMTLRLATAADASVDTHTGHVLLSSATPVSKRQAHEPWVWESPARLVAGGAVRNRDLVEPTTERLRLPLEPPFDAFYRRALEGHPPLAPGQTTLLIPKSKALLKRLAVWCNEVNRRCGSRLTQHRIAHYLPWRAASERDLDPVMVAYIRGAADVTSATQAYYQRCDPAVLHGAVSSLWQNVVEAALAESHGEPPDWLGAAWPQQALHLDSGGPGVGSAKLPTRAALRRILAYVVTRIRQAKSGKDLAPWAHVRRYHNAYALYTLHFFLWATGARAARDPLPDLRFVDRASGLVLLCDKSADDRYSTRLVWVGPDLLEHLDHYRAHLDAVATRLLVVRPDVYHAHARTMAHWRGGGTPGPGEDGLKSLFFELTSSGRLDVLTPELATDTRIPAALALPANCNRHFMRNYLRDRHCRNDMVDAQLGHWHHGREPWGASSSLSPGGFAAVMRRYLGTMTRELGYRPMRSIFVSAAKAGGRDVRTSPGG